MKNKMIIGLGITGATILGAGLIMRKKRKNKQTEENKSEVRIELTEKTKNE